MQIAAVFALTFLTSLTLALAQESDEGNAVLQTERDLATASPMFPQQDSKRRCNGGCVRRRPAHQSRIIDLRSLSQCKRAGAFTLLLVVIGIITVLLVLIAPAFTTIKSSTDVTSAAYTIKGVLDTARTYAKANNTYTLPEAFSRAIGASCLAFWELWPPVSVEVLEFSKEPTPSTVEVSTSYPVLSAMISRRRCSDGAARKRSD